MQSAVTYAKSDQLACRELAVRVRRMIGEIELGFQQWEIEIHDKVLATKYCPRSTNLVPKVHSILMANWLLGRLGKPHCLVRDARHLQRCEWSAHIIVGLDSRQAADNTPVVEEDTDVIPSVIQSDAVEQKTIQ